METTAMILNPKNLAETIYGNNTEALIKMLQDGANPDDYVPGNPAPLILAAKCDNLGAVKLLHEFGADPCISDIHDQDRTALYYAVVNRNEDMAKSLLDAGADPNVQYNNGKVLDCALENEDYRICQLITEANHNQISEELLLQTFGKLVDGALSTAKQIKDRRIEISMDLYRRVSELKEIVYCLPISDLDKSIRKAEEATEKSADISSEKPRCAKCGCTSIERLCSRMVGDEYDWLCDSCDDQWNRDDNHLYESGDKSPKSENEPEDSLESQLRMLREAPSQTDRQITEIQDTLKTVVSRLTLLENRC